jgi:hypothetical protein
MFLLIADFTRFFLKSCKWSCFIQVLNWKKRMKCKKFYYITHTNDRSIKQQNRPPFKNKILIGQISNYIFSRAYRLIEYRQNINLVMENFLCFIKTTKKLKAKDKPIIRVKCSFFNEFWRGTKAIFS